MTGGVRWSLRKSSGSAAYQSHDDKRGHENCKDWHGEEHLKDGCAQGDRVRRDRRGGEYFHVGNERAARQVLENVLERVHKLMPRRMLQAIPVAHKLIEALDHAANAQRGSCIPLYALSTQIDTLVCRGRLSEIVAIPPSMLPGVYSPPTAHEIQLTQSLKTKVRYRESRLARGSAGPSGLWSSAR
ncbi:hypothetical protein HYPSUDRAFT_209239 [Hypholoma sublateritium FD-334 SS-4]|uniref:Uncharacterized protein n=1 Tax=Hypholoma sublateritium (strain FD-334 SS-4) TaxID=945553 RepID=A0A0D2NB52_HYPSF|nr:hypothetical protein HYPSUDRAFT_209239 [Hypholoma sublateritium FD-334 SS-4]